ncbi:MAG: hypothetical protein HOP35_09475 [Nitrospira sp.]|nr:hypothetical protein [Nitrospira sp.]
MYDILALIVCLGVGLLSYSIGAPREVANWGVETDFLGRDVGQAQNILSGQPYTNQHYPPGYAYVLAGMSLLTHDFFKAGIIISVLASTLFGLVSYGIITILFDRRLAFVTTLLVLLALLPHSFEASTDMLANFLLLLPLWILFRRAPTMNVCIQSGLTAGLAYLVRYNTIFVLVGIPLALLFLSPAEDSIRQRICKIVAFATAALAVTAPWLLINWQYHGNPFASDLHGQVAAHFYHPEGDGSTSSIQHMQQQFGSYWDVFFYDPVRLMRNFMKDILYDRPLKLSWSVIGFPAILFAGAGMLLYLRDLTRSRAVFLLVCGMGYLLHGLAGFADRFYLFLYPLLFLFVGLAVFELGRVPVRLQEVPKVWNLSWMIVTCLLIVSAYTSFVNVRGLFLGVPVHLLEAAEILRARASLGDAIMGYKPHLAYLAKLSIVAIEGPDTIEEYLQRAKENNVRFIVYSEFEERYWKGLHALRDPALMPKEFRVVYEHIPSKTFVYEIARPSDRQKPME